MGRRAGIDLTTRWGFRVGAGVTAAAVVLCTGVADATAEPSATPAGPIGLASAPTAPVGPWGDAKADTQAKQSTGRNAADADPGSLYTAENAINARTVWLQKDAARQQITGQGVGVALLDSGVNPVAGLNGDGKLVDGPDLSLEANGPLIDQDTFGHGTHLAGIIAAHDPVALTPTTIPNLAPSTQLGVAPDATLEAIKLGTTDGSTDVSQVIAALDWITQHQTTADGTRIRVVNLSFGTDSAQAYQADPLAAAAENAWRHGLVVVVSGGNEGPLAGRLTDPAMDPYVLSVGASSGADTVSGWADPTVAPFSSSGTADRHVDVLAPGQSIVSLRDPGSFIDANHPEGLVSGDTTGRLFRGSGTSQAAAVVSGAVALLLQAYPNMTPDQVKALLMSTAAPVDGTSLLTGAGQIDVAAALAAAKTAAKKGVNPARYTQTWSGSDGHGSIEAARGGYHLVDADGNPLTGEIDVQGNTWDPASWWSSAKTLSSWQGGTWNDAAWTGTGWDTTGDGLSSARWSSARWSSARWSDADWQSARWSSARWSSARWSSARWSDAGWDSARWSDSGWN